MNLTYLEGRLWLSEGRNQKKMQESHFPEILGGICGSTYPDFACMEPKSEHRALPPQAEALHIRRAAHAGCWVPTACRANADFFFEHLIFPKKKRNQAHKTQQWTDEQLCIYIEFPGNKACSPTSLSLFGGKLCFAFSQCPLPSPVCSPNLN